MARHYLDHASTSPLRPQALAAMTAALAEPAADPGRIHAEGMRARFELEQAREQVATFLGARSREVVFTSGATEAIAAAVHGAADLGRSRPGADGHVVVAAIEHSAVRKAVAAHWPDDAITIVGCDGTGRVDPDDVLAAITPATTFVAVQMANHEVGTIQPVGPIVAGCRQRGVLTLVDAAAAAGRIPVAFADAGSGVGPDLLAVSAHKLGGPAGIGALLVRRGLRIEPLLLGGDQERARRAGLENLPAAAGFGAAAAALAEPGALAAEIERIAPLADRVRTVMAGIDGVTVFGPADPEQRVPHLVCVGIDGIEPQGVLLGLDQAGIAAHSGSSCSSESLEPSPVLEAMGVDAHRSLRVSLGWSSTAADVDALAAALPTVVTRLRALAG